MMMYPSIPAITALLMLMNCTIVSSDSTTAKLKVFLLAGQSNMVGFGSNSHLDSIVKTDGTSDTDLTISTVMRNDIRRSVWNDTTKKYITRDDVYVKYNNTYSGTTGYHGYLTVNGSSGFAFRNHFGPEIMFGHTIGDAIRSFMKNYTRLSKRPNVLLIKTAYSGRSLEVDFRPPSAVIIHNRGIDIAKYGATYRTMMAEIKSTLRDLNKYVPNYNSTIGYELSGFVWFQGYKDSTELYKVEQYQSNLGHFIRDVRKELNVLQLPFVIGELGMHGRNLSIYSTDEANRVSKMRQAQSNVCNLPEFKNNTRFVPTAQYSVQLVPSTSATTIKTFDHLKHYYGRADTIHYVGRDLGRSMMQLMGY